MKMMGIKKKQRLRKSRSMVSSAVELLVPVCLLFAILLLFLFRNMWEAKEMAYRYMKDMATVNATRVNEDISKVNSEMVYLIQQDKNIEGLPDDISPQMTAYYKLLQDIISLNKMLKIRYDGKYLFYEYVEAAELLILDKSAYFPVSVKSEVALELEKMIKGYLSGERKRSEWNYFVADGMEYLFCFYETGGKAVGCIIALGDLFTNFNISNLGYEGIPYLVMENGEILIQGDKDEKLDIQTLLEGSRFRKPTVYAYQLGRIGELHLLIASNGGILDKIIILQLANAILAIGIVLGVGIITCIYYKKILTPMRQFVKKLSDPKEEKWIHDTEDQQIMELEMASAEFRQMMRQIQSLKIAIYEKELMQSRTELEYVQEQINSHFFLNCISVIHGMAEMHHAQDIVLMAEKLSDYVRYVVNDSYVLREIRQEVAHIRDYIDIQKMRYKDFFHFEVISDEEVDKCLIPPLVLQVFVENAINHGVNFERQVEITLYMVEEQYHGEDYLYICISDTGGGFTDESLDKIKNGKSIEYNGRRHVGVQNTLKRLQIIYGDKAEVNFFNMSEHYGAVVELRIPVFHPSAAQ